MKSIFQAIWRSGGSVAAGVALTAFLSTPWGMVATPVLQGISKGIKKRAELNGRLVPSWVSWLPF